MEDIRYDSPNFFTRLANSAKVSRDRKKITHVILTWNVAVTKLLHFHWIFMWILKNWVATRVITIFLFSVIRDVFIYPYESEESNFSNAERKKNNSPSRMKNGQLNRQAMAKTNNKSDDIFTKPPSIKCKSINKKSCITSENKRKNPQESIEKWSRAIKNSAMIPSALDCFIKNTRYRSTKISNSTYGWTQIIEKVLTQ